MDASSFYTDKYDEELMISVKTSEDRMHWSSQLGVHKKANMVLELQYCEHFYQFVRPYMTKIMTNQPNLKMFFLSYAYSF